MHDSQNFTYKIEDFAYSQLRARYKKLVVTFSQIAREESAGYVSFAMHTNIYLANVVFPSFWKLYEVIVCNGTVWQRMFFFIETMRGVMYMAQISVNNLSFGFEESFDYVFENVSFSIDTNWKLGFIGRNEKRQDQNSYQGNRIIILGRFAV